MAREMAGWVLSSFSPAREKLFSVATVRKTFNGYSSIRQRYAMKYYYTSGVYYKFA